MFITKKKHLAIIAAHENENQRLVALLTDQSEMKALVRRSQDKSDALLERLTENSKGYAYFASNNLSGANLILPDDVPRYVPDHFGGKVIRQEATKVIEIDPDGTIKTGLTKRPPDEGFTYILNRKTQ